MKTDKTSFLDYDSCKPHLMETNINADYLKFECPSRIVVSGGTATGKTTLLCKILQNHKKHFEEPLDNLIYLNPMLETNTPFAPRATVQNLMKTFPNMMIGHEMPPSKDHSLETWLRSQQKRQKNTITHLGLLLDDFQSSLHLMEKALTDIFARLSHHATMSVFITLQNPYPGSGVAKRSVDVIIGNANVVIMFQSVLCPRLFSYLEQKHDPLGAEAAGRKLSGRGLRRCLKEAGKWMSSPAHGYIVINFNTHCRLRDVFPVTSCIVGEINQNVLALLFYAEDYDEKETHFTPQQTNIQTDNKCISQHQKSNKAKKRSSTENTNDDISDQKKLKTVKKHPKKHLIDTKKSPDSVQDKYKCDLSKIPPHKMWMYEDHPGTTTEDEDADELDKYKYKCDLSKIPTHKRWMYEDHTDTTTEAEGEDEGAKQKNEQKEQTANKENDLDDPNDSLWTV